MRPRRTFVALSLLVATACGGDDGASGVPELGDGDGSPGSVQLTVVADAADGLSDPRDLAFNPLRPDELWVVNAADDSVVLVFDASSAEPTSEKRTDGYALHFMDEVTALAFGQDETTIGLPGTFASCGESRNTYNGQAAGNDFMGPSLWSSDLSIFAKMNPNGLGSHLDMLHNTPLCLGIAHDSANQYWVVNGLRGSIDRYDFGTDDGIGNDNHGDGKTWRYADGALKAIAGVPSHAALDAATGMLYVADTGNARVARLDTASGTDGTMVPGLETPVKNMDDAVVEDLVSAADDLVRQPSGLELHDGTLFVADSETSFVTAFDLDGELVDFLNTGLPAGALGGMAFGPDGRLYLVDRAGDRVVRVDPLP